MSSALIQKYAVKATADYQNKTEDRSESETTAASFLLALKHNRSVTPEPTECRSTALAANAVGRDSTNDSRSCSGGKATVSTGPTNSTMAKTITPSATASPTLSPTVGTGMVASASLLPRKVYDSDDGVSNEPSLTDEQPQDQQQRAQARSQQQRAPAVSQQQLHTPPQQQQQSQREQQQQQQGVPPAIPSDQPLSLDCDATLDLLLDDSSLVMPQDRDLVPDPLFVAMAQMQPCELTEADRVGCYKARTIGFTGMSCKHCGGQPGFGKYFPASVRSLAQTTTSQTIIKHVGSKCRFCPPHIRQAVLELQRRQVIKEGSSNGRPRYGSRKVFFQRVWGRLHNEVIPVGGFSEKPDPAGNVGVPKRTPAPATPPAAPLSAPPAAPPVAPIVPPTPTVAVGRQQFPAVTATPRAPARAPMIHHQHQHQQQLMMHRFDSIGGGRGMISSDADLSAFQSPTVEAAAAAVAAVGRKFHVQTMAQHQHHRFGALPTKQNLKRKMEDVEHASKRIRSGFAFS